MAPEPLGALLVESLMVPLAVMVRQKLVDDVLINDFDSLALRDETLIP